jgi:hypothetical protein
VASGTRSTLLTVGGAFILMAALTGCSGTRAPTPIPSAFLTGRPPTTTTTPAATDPLTGGKLSTAGVFAVKIDNVPAAHPQVGLDQADIVVAERVEADLTRMIAIFHTAYPSRVGPVRSARNTDVQYLPMFGKPGLVFSGANRKVLAQVRKASVVPIERSDRDHSRPAPHNVIVNLKQLAAQHHVGPVQPIGMTFATKDSRWDRAGKDASFKVKIGSDTFGFSYGRGSYTTSWNARLNHDGDTGRAVRTNNVIVLEVRTHRDHQTTSHLSEVSETTGSGKVTIYRDARLLAGTWSRPSVSAPMRFTDGTGRDIALEPGRSWILLQG